MEHVLWLGGTGGVGKTTAARSIARRYDLRLYSIDSYTYAHAQQLPHDARSLDEIWVESSPRELARWFADQARARFPLVLSDLLRLPRDVPILVEGPQLLPELVGRHVLSPDRAVFVTASGDLRRRLLIQRGSGLVELARDPKKAFENRVGRDEILAEWLRRELAASPLTLIEVSRVEETEAAIERYFTAALREWDARADRGDVSARRREENDARLRQWRANADRFGDASGELAFACECAVHGCAETVPLGLAEAEERRSDGRAFEAHP